MPITFPPFHIEDAINDPVTRYHRRVDIYEADNSTLWRRGAPLVGGRVTVEMGRQERRTGSLTLLNVDSMLDIDRVAGLWYDKVVRVTMGVTSSTGSWETSIGTFLIDKFSSEDVSDVLPFALRDFSAKLQYDLPFAVSWAAATPIENIISDIAAGGGVPVSQQNLPLTGINTTEERSFTQGTARWRAMQEVATAHGYDLYFDTVGVLQMDPFTDPFTSTPQFVFKVGDDSNLASIGREISGNLIRNHIIVEGSTVNDVPVWGEALNNAPSSPTRIERLGYRPKRIENSWVVTNEQATSVAENVLKYESLERHEASLGTLLVPWLDVNVTVEFDDPRKANGDPTRYLLNRIQIPLDLGVAEARVGRVTSVIEAPGLYPSLTTYPSSTTFPSPTPT